MSRYLIVANQTLGGDLLHRALEERIERGDSQFYVVVPMTAPQDLHVVGINPLMEGGAPGGSAEGTSEQDKAYNRAEHRLNLLIEKIKSNGGKADGEVGDPDPVVAVKDVLRTQTFDEIIISTLPAGPSRWLKMDLSGRVSRMAETPVTVVTAKS